MRKRAARRRLTQVDRGLPRGDTQTLGARRAATYAKRRPQCQTRHPASKFLAMDGARRHKAIHVFKISQISWSWCLPVVMYPHQGGIFDLPVLHDARWLRRRAMRSQRETSCHTLSSASSGTRPFITWNGSLADVCMSRYGRSIEKGTWRVCVLLARVHQMSWLARTTAGHSFDADAQWLADRSNCWSRNKSTR